MKKIKWGILGCGKIAGKFATDLALVETAELTAVASRSLKKATEFGTKHQSTKFYGAYEDLLSDTEVDIIYIANPHPFHAEWSIKVMEHGKHVLCEKPLAINKIDAKRMIATSKKTNCFFMEALWTRFNPVFVEVLKKIKNGDIGEVNYVNADFSFKSNHALESRVYNLSLGGGALLDIGIYPIFLAYTLLGNPEKVSANAILHPKTGADIQTSIILQYPNSQALLFSGFTSDSKMLAKISGTKGEIIMNPRWHESESYTIIKDGQEEIFHHSKIGKGYTHEILECQKCLYTNRIESDLWSHQNSLDLIGLLDDIRGKIGLKYPNE